MDKITILWADDEIDLLKPHIMFLEDKGYEVIAVTSGDEALDELSKQVVDIVFLDENMPGISGLDTLSIVKNRYPMIPVVMITKSEEEHIMDEALGGKISDYLIKPVKPNQILLTVKKHTEGKRLADQKSIQNYQQNFRSISMELMNPLSAEEWIDIYKRLVQWDLELSKTEDRNTHEILYSQRAEANQLFCRFYEQNYEDWLSGRIEKPLISPTVLKEKLFPLLHDDRPTFLIVIDNFRFDQWKYTQPTIENLFHTEEECIYYSILPTTTQYARNALFSGLMPSEIEKKYPQYWINETEEGNKNQFEHELLDEYLKRYGINIKHTYHKVLNAAFGKKLIDSIPRMMQNKLTVVIYNFIDMLSHARTELDIIRELAENEQSYRSLTLSWLEHSPLMEFLKRIAEEDVNVIITTDHGSVKINNPVKVKGDKDVSVNLRYKVGRLLDYTPKQVYEVKDASKIFLPKLYVTSPYIFAHRNDFFAYPNNYNQYVQYYMNTFQHGGISMEENLIPFIILKNR